MPLCPQITITPITVTSSNMTVTSVIAGGDPATTETVNTVSGNATQALADAAAAQSTANTALANAATAQSTANTAISTANSAISTANTALSDAASAQAAAAAAQAKANTSLQTSANTIVNASNQLTAINGNGIAVYTGASSTSGARVLLNSLGLVGFDSTSTSPTTGRTFSIDATTGSVYLKGEVTATTGTFTGTVIATTGTFTGTVTATTGTFTGTVIANTGTFTGTVIATTGVFTGTVIATTGSFTGSVIATTGSFTGAVYANTGSFTGSVIATTGSFTGAVYANSGYIGSASGWNFSPSGYLTNSGGTTILYPTTNTYALISDRAVSASQIVATGTAGNSINAAGGGTFGGAVSMTGLTCSSITNSGTTYSGGDITTAGGVNTSGTINVNSGSVVLYASTGNIDATGAYSRLISGRTLLVNSGGGIGTSSSSRTIKQDIADADIDPTPLLDLPLQQFRYIADVEENGDNATVQIGLMAEDVAAAGLEYLIDRDKDGNPNYIFWTERMPQALLQLIQNQAKQIKVLEARVTALESK